MDDETPGDRKRPRWQPELVAFSSADVPRERIGAAAPEGGVPPMLLGKANQLQQAVATILVRRKLMDRGSNVVGRMHRSGIMFLECRSLGDERSLGLVVASVSSMEPRPIWPTLIPLPALELAAVDWIASCSVPKQPAFDALDERSAEAYLLGWLTADDVAKLPIVDVAPHAGHEFEAKYRQVKHHKLRPFSEWP